MAATNPAKPSVSAQSSTPRAETDAFIDLAIIGGGPAALSAALYAARAGLGVKVFERAGLGGALSEISHLSNYPGFDGTGPALAEAMRTQATAAGAEIAYGECQKLWRYADHFELIIDGDPVRARRVLVATGSTPKKLAFTPRPPVSYCALCDGDLVKGKHVAVIGGANSAVQESLYLVNLAADLTIITHSRLKADAYLQRRLAELQTSHPIKVLEDTEPTPELLDTFDHIFVFIGKRPATDFLRPLANSLLESQSLLDPAGYLLTPSPNTPSPNTSLGASGQKSLDPAAPSHATVVPGLYAAGDVRSGSIKQVVIAAADGAAAAIEIAASFNISSAF